MTRLSHQLIRLWRMPTLLSFLLFYFIFSPFPVQAQTQPVISTILRPNPNELVPYEKQKLITDPTLTPYCIQRPTVVQNILYNKAISNPVIHFLGALFTNFSSFTTPFLNTDVQTPTLTESQKSYQYLNQYLGDHPASNLESLGMFEKLAPKIYQDQLKVAMVNRALGTFTPANNPYGFEPATPTVHDYPVVCWNGTQVVDFTDPNLDTCGTNELLTLSSFKNNLIPLPEDYPDLETYQTAYDAWKIKDDGKWYQTWQFVPKFTLEDTKGFIKVIPEPFQIPVIPNPIEVSHPFLAKTYELSSALFHLLTPKPQPPAENYNTEQWYGPPWETDPWWFKSDENQSQWTPNVGPICDQTNPPIYGTGALAYSDLITSSINRTFILSISPDTSCIIVKTDPITGTTYNDYSNCLVTQEARYSPVYDESYTPFLKEINSNLYAPNGIFNLMEPYNTIEKEYLPGAAIDKTANFTYSSFSSSRAEAGMKIPGDIAEFLYRYLGSIHCAKQKLIRAIQPFLGMELAESVECSPNAPGPVLNANSNIPVPGSGVGVGATDANGNVIVAPPITQVTESCAQTAGAWVYQSDKAWANTPCQQHPELTYCTIGASGCGSASVTAILNSFGNTNGIINVWNKQHEMGGYTYDYSSSHLYCSTIHGYAMSILGEAGLHTQYLGTGTPEDWKNVKTTLDKNGDCGLIYASGVAGWGDNRPATGHVLVITGIIEEGGNVTKIITLDSGTNSGNGLIRPIDDTLIYEEINYIPNAYNVNLLYKVTK